MRKYIKKIIKMCKDTFPEALAKYINEKVIIGFLVLAILTILRIFFVSIYDKLIYPPFNGEVVEVSYNPCLIGQNLGKTFISTEIGTFYYYEGNIKVLLQGEGKIESAFFLYNNDSKITSGDVYTADVERKNGQFEIIQTIYLRSNDCKKKIPIYLAIIDKKTHDKNLYCVILDLNSMNTSSVIKIEDSLNAEDKINVEYSMNPDAEKLNLQYEAYSKQEIQKLEKNLNGSYAASIKNDILIDIEKIESMNLQ